MHQLRGGSFVAEESDYEKLMTPEDFTDEQRMIADMITDFVAGEIEPVDEKIEKLDYALNVEKIRAAGKLGILGADIPEIYGGLGLDKVSSLLLNEKLSKASSFSLTMGGHTGIGTLPIVYFGTDEQKRKYLPALGSGEKIAAYCLTEASSGSDALSIKTTAKLSADGKHYILNGSKQFITNAGFADIFIVYAKVNGTEFSAFIVERSMEGVSIGPEEKKMGLKGTSTCPMAFEDVEVPVENVLGEVGKGHLIAFNVLNIGRLKLASGSLGISKDALEYSVKYANERTQFGRKISSFPLIGRKLAEMNMRIYALESMVYRTAGVFDDVISKIDHAGGEVGQQSLKAIAEYALECSINKVFGTETLNFAADEGVQIHGGYGFIQEYRIERIFRDSRVYRIFEGSNEINRLLITGTILKRAARGELQLGDVTASDTELKEEAANGTYNGLLEQESRLVANSKRMFRMLQHKAVNKYGRRLDQEQEIVSHLSDILISIYAMESALLRTKKRIALFGEAKAANAIDMTTVFIFHAIDRLENWAEEVMTGLEDGELLEEQLAKLRMLMYKKPVNRIGLIRQIAERVAAAEKYVV